MDRFDVVHTGPKFKDNIKKQFQPIQKRFQKKLKHFWKWEILA